MILKFIINNTKYYYSKMKVRNMVERNMSMKGISRISHTNKKYIKTGYLVTIIKIGAKTI